jgi:hypothetical protein
MKVIRMPTDFLVSLDLTISCSNLFGERKFEFDETVSYVQEEKDKFKELVFDRDGYLTEDHNYFKVPGEDLSFDRNAITLKNQRVIVFWRNINLTERVTKQIVTLGFAYLLNIVNDAELVFRIRQMLPLGVHGVSVKSIPNTYVIIGIEPPIFSF